MSIASQQSGSASPKSAGDKSAGDTTLGSGKGRLDAGWLKVPESLERQLLDFRRSVWSMKMIEGVAIATVAIVAALLAVYAADRFADTPVWVRTLLLAGLVAMLAALGLHFYRWFRRTDGLERLAVLLGKKLPSVGDSMLGVIELAKNHEEQSRSPALCQAAMRQVADDAKKRDFLSALPDSRHRTYASVAAILLTGFIGLFALYPAATSSAVARLFTPWSGVERYTFTRVESLPEQWYVAHGEPLDFQLALLPESRWKPDSAQVQVGSQIPVDATLVNKETYSFVLPPQIEDQKMTIAIGDTKQTVNVIPTLRPELVEVSGEVRLPEYLGRSETLTKDARGGTLAAVKGSVAKLNLKSSRTLSQATIGDSEVDVRGDQFSSEEMVVDETQVLQMNWTDEYGLAGRESFDLTVTALDDESPTLICDGLPRQAVILESELLKFQVRANDDFGVKQVGIMWRGIAENGLSTAGEGERVLAAGGVDRESLEVLGTFSAASMNIEPQPIELFVWVEDYLPQRPRVFSPPYTLFVLTPDQHAIWMTEQLSKWHRQSLEVRDRELQLYETNKELRELGEEELNLADTRQRIQRQAQAEKSNGRRLARLSGMGDELVRQAARNPEIGVGHLERWAEMLQVLKDISQNRMPNVSDLLQDAAEAPRLASGAAKKSGPMVGEIRTMQQGPPGETKPGEPKGPDAPQLVDVESSQNSPNDEPGEPGKPKKPNKPALRLPTTVVMGPGGKKEDKEEEAEKVEEAQTLDPAIEAQEDLLAEFEKIADELNSILANLEGSTLVKRLKAESRNQYLVAGKIAESLDDSFGRRSLEDDVTQSLEEMVKQEEESVQEISYIMDDMAAYFERRRFAQFKDVLEQMRNEDVIGGIRQLTEEIKNVQGLSVSQCEYWSDALDRWAEDLVDPACSGQCPGGKSPASLPPSIVLEVMQILEAEINLREETRVAHQAKDATTLDEYMNEGLRLSQSQIVLQERVVKVFDRIMELQDAEKHFGKELKLLDQVDVVMGQGAEILAIPDCGPRAIAAETEAIELLLQSKRINPKSGGGGGSSPGGGGTGETTDAALALLGTGVNQKEVREDRGIQQVTGESGTELPAEFRAGLDEYFNRIDGAPAPLN